MFQTAMMLRMKILQLFLVVKTAQNARNMQVLSAHGNMPAFPFSYAKISAMYIFEKFVKVRKTFSILGPFHLYRTRVGFRKMIGGEQYAQAVAQSTLCYDGQFHWKMIRVKEKTKELYQILTQLLVIIMVTCSKD